MSEEYKNHEDDKLGYVIVSRKKGTAVVVGDVMVFISKVGSRRVTLCFTAGDTPVHRLELLHPEEAEPFINKLPSEYQQPAREACEQYHRTHPNAPKRNLAQ